MTVKKKDRALIVYLEDQNRDKVQSQLAASLSDEQKSQLYRAFLEDTISNCLELDDVDIRISHPAGVTGKILNEIVENLKTVLTGKALKLLKSPRFSLTETAGGSAGDRISNAFKSAFDEGFGSVVLIGCVTPTLPTSTIMSAFKRVTRYDLVIGPTLEGSYYLLGMSKHLPVLFEQIDWSDDRSIYSQMTAICKDGCGNWDEMDLWYDLRQPEDLEFLVRDINHFRLVGDEKSAVRTEQVLEEILKNLPS
jgi:glycosyltransferase A (GT-A) superfamily protein (DUF2064 family)